MKSLFSNLSFYKTLKDDRGILNSIELDNFKLFKIKRVFLISFKKNIKRGDHAHKKCKQYLICTKGKIKVELFRRKTKKTIYLSPKSKGLYVEPKTWNVLMPLMKNSEIICLCDMKYLKSDYILDFKKFQNY
jgi:dTDP-4-dehydrorhamnose 3,5-epimerase-like enzyme